MIYEGWSHAVPEAIRHLENCSKYKNYFGKLEHRQLDYPTCALMIAPAMNSLSLQQLSKSCKKIKNKEVALLPPW